jgi:hypothetical protein
LPEYERDFKALHKKFKTMEDDFKVFQRAQIVLYHKLGVDNGGIFPIPGLGFECPRVFKAKKFACRSLKGKGCHSGIRVIYAYYQNEDRLEFVEIYFKADQANEDRKRIHQHYKPKDR